MIDAKWNVRLAPLVWGFILSIVLTLVSYFSVALPRIASWAFILIIVGLSCVQAIAQLVFFMQLGVESKPRWGLVFFLFMVLVITVVIGGSLWIMYNLNYNVMLTEGH